MRSGEYTMVMRDGKPVHEHRVVWEQAHGPIPDGLIIDHINGVGTDNRIENLRLVTTSGNAKNAKLYSTNKTGVTGVSWDKGKAKWMASICSKGNKMVLGRYTDWFEAVCARMSANNTYGFHKNHGRR